MTVRKIKNEGPCFKILYSYSSLVFAGIGMCRHVQVDGKIRSELPSGPALAKLGFNLSSGDGRLMRAKKSIPYNNKIPLMLPIAVFPR